MSARRYNSFCSGVVRMLCVFPEHRCSKTVLHIWEDKTTAPQVSVAALVRARKTRFKPASHVCMTNLCRTVDCTPYLSSAPLCFCGEKSDDRPANALPYSTETTVPHNAEPPLQNAECSGARRQNGRQRAPTPALEPAWPAQVHPATGRCDTADLEVCATQDL